MKKVKEGNRTRKNGENPKIKRVKGKKKIGRAGMPAATNYYTDELPKR